MKNTTFIQYIDIYPIVQFGTIATVFYTCVSISNSNITI